ncbi:CD48 antigen isoform X2 [Rousettus aegyptiacus]|uniref:Ig-like domain-containing protein n=1 Tax=Rousettus aegyptiacus TaxID=9407 RepID=A0A7J8BE74_ROUAE|nr:CD48 antigen isoform X2 [Rousettus aegyptiacus]KAF6397123.1 hypothetical protein HJG63_009786 [Rousettus aegyptiacus]
MESRSRRLGAQTLLLRAGLLLALPLPGPRTAQDPGSSCTLKRTVGESAQLRLSSSLSPDVREVEWTWDAEDGRQWLLVSWKPNGSHAEWYELDEKYKRKFRLMERALLAIENLTVDMSGRYTAKIKFKTGKSQEEDFRLCLYEPIPHPQIQVHLLSNTTGRCNVSLECATPGTAENLTVTWLSKGLPGELDPSGALGSAPGSRRLSLSLPWGQLDGHLTCVVSNPVDRKNVTLPVESVCLWRGSLQSQWLWAVILPVVLMVSLGAGIWTWCRRRKAKAGRGEAAPPAAAPQALVPEESAGLQSGEADSCEPPPYAEITWRRHSKKGLETGSGHSAGAMYTPEVHTIYQKIQISPEPQGRL